MNVLNLIGRDSELFCDDVGDHEATIRGMVNAATFLVIGAAGTIGKAVTKELFKRHPKQLHVVDISENNLVELVRDLRSSEGYIDGDFKTFAIDCGAAEFEALMELNQGYDYVFNLSALKHVRSEKDPFTLMRLIDTNIFNIVKTYKLADKYGAKKYFCVSTDKAANPVNMMGASKRIMELFLLNSDCKLPVSMARFANVAFSDGSLLHGFNQRVARRQPISSPKDVRRYFVIEKEAGELCLLAGLLGAHGEIFFPKLGPQLHLIRFSDIARNYLSELNYAVLECETEELARSKAESAIPEGLWPCYFFDSDTTGEKDFEEFYTDEENVYMERFKNIGVIENALDVETDRLNKFSDGINKLKSSKQWSREALVGLVCELLDNFDHKETGKFLDGRM